MSDFTPWLICFGVFIFMPSLAFVMGWYIGRHGMPLEIKIKKRKPQGLAADGYGVATDTG